MKGSAITGPVAKECVRVISYIVRLLLGCSNLVYIHRLTYGRVSRQTQALWFEWDYLFVLFIHHVTCIKIICSSMVYDL